MGGLKGDPNLEKDAIAITASLGRQDVIATKLDK